MGLPSIVSDISGCNEIIEDNINGFLVPPKNQTELEKFLHNLFINRNLINLMKDNSRKIEQDKFNKDIVWNALLKEYYKILQEAHL